jgi:hypothetical protein
MGRYILRYKHAAQAPSSDLEKIRAAPNLKVIDESPRMMLVEADEEAAHASVNNMDGWTVSPETMTPLPDTRKKIR